MLRFSQLSFWEKTTYLLGIDYLIIGSGIVGLSTAIHLKRKHPNKKVCILERGYLPSGASTKNAGFACIGSASEILNDLTWDSENNVFDTVARRWKGLKYLRELLNDAEMNYQNLGSHELFRNDEREEYEKCLAQLDYLNKQLYSITGIKNVYQPAPTTCKVSGFAGFTNAISNAVEGQIDTGIMVQSLISKAQKMGIYLLNGIEVISIEKNELETNRGKIRFVKLAICNNGLAKQFLPDEDIQPARAQVLITSPIPDLKIKGIYHFNKGYYYFRNVGNRILFGGARNLNFHGEETTNLETTNEIIDHLKQILGKNLLPKTAFEVEHHWAGTMGLGKTKSPIVKQLEPNIFCGVRLGGMGIAIGSLVGNELAELMS